MKTILLILPLTGAALLASAAEPVKPETPSATATLSATKNSPSNAATGGAEAASKSDDAKLSKRLARSGAVTTKPGSSVAKGFLQSLNPFAPMKPAPTAPWLSRAPWSAAAESGAVSSTPVEVRHEAKCGIVVCSQ